MQEIIKDKKNILANFFIILGVAMIVAVVIYSFLIFTAKKPAPQIFLEDVSIENKTGTQNIDSNMNVQEIQKNISKELNDQVKSIFYEFAPRMLNLVSWSIFAWIVIGAGAKISHIGKEML